MLPVDRAHFENLRLTIAASTGTTCLGTSRFQMLLRVRNYGDDLVSVALYEKVEAPVAVDAGLPEATCLAVFLGMQGGVLQIDQEEPQLLFERLAHFGRSGGLVVG